MTDGGNQKKNPAAQDQLQVQVPWRGRMGNEVGSHVAHGNRKYR